jgi:enoyl-CoA hydratase
MPAPSTPADRAPEDLARYDRFEGLRFERPADGVLRILIDNPDKRNAVDRARHGALADVWPEVDRDPVTRVAIVQGVGTAFSAGGDLEMVRDVIADENTRLGVLREARDLVYNLVNCSKIVVSAIEGPAVGAGAATALLADISIAARSAKIIDGHTRLGVAAGDHAVILWPLLCGMAKAKYHLLTCETLTGEEAERIGLVSLVVDDGQAADRALEIATSLAAGAQPALRFTKLALNNWLRTAGPAFDASLAFEFLGFTGADAAEGVDAVSEKRPPEFPSAR